MSDGRVNILIVDDKPDKVLALQALLEDLGQNIFRAYSGRDALRCLLHNEFAVILLDVNMPGMDGFETAELIRRRPSSQSVPIIFITAFGDEAYSSRGYSLGAVDFIQTPVVADVLRSKVSVFVDLARKTEQVQRQAESLRRRATQLQKLAAAALAINRARAIDELLQTITDCARDIVGCHQASTMFLRDPYSGRRDGRSHAICSFSERYASWRNRSIALDPLASSLIAQNRSATRMTADELRDHPDSDLLARLDIPRIVGGILAAPFIGRDGNNLGIIYLAERLEGEFTHDDEAVLVQLAQMASIAIENTLFAEEREANRIKDEFLSTLSHELRTPLNAILGWSQLLRMGSTAEDLQHGLETIERNARAQAKLIEDLLDVSRITSGKLQLNRVPLRVGTIIEAALESMKPMASEKGVALIWEGPGCDDATVGDPDRLQQVAWNLLSNAVKFTPAGGRVETRLDSVNGQLRLQVIDNGRGILPAFLPHVFDRFRQADSSSTRSHGGLGIGLSIVRRILELHGASVQAESAGEGKGATFTVFLPIAAQTPVDMTPMLAADRALRTGLLPSAALQGVRVLVVDDEQDALDVLMHMLIRTGATVCGGTSVREALDLMRKQSPDLIVTDIAMPDEDGFDLMRSVRHMENGRRIPLIAVTAFAREEDHARSISAGFDRHLAKPIDPADLVAAINSILQKTPAQDAHSIDNGQVVAIPSEPV